MKTSWIFSTICLTLLSHLPSAASDLWLIPQPKEQIKGETVIPTPKTVRLKVPAEAEEIFQEMLALLDEPKDRISVRADSSVEGWSFKTTDMTILPEAPADEPDGYTLQITAQWIAASANSLQGLRYALLTLRQILNHSGNMPEVTIRDYPSLKQRGFMIDMVRLKEKDSYYFYLLRQIAELKVNELYLHLTDNDGCSIELKRHPELATINAMDQETLKSLIHDAHILGVTLVPEIESWGHARWILSHHPELAEGDRLDSLCLTEEAVYPLLESILAEVAGVFPGETIHLGCDEAIYGLDDRCKLEIESMGAGKLIAKHINRLNRYVRSLGKTSAIWSDVVLKYPDALEYLDKDIRQVNRDYRPVVTDQSAIRLKESGFPVLIAPAIVWSANRVTASSETLLNVEMFTAIAQKLELAGTVTTCWLPQRYVADSIGHGIAFAAEVSWGSGPLPRESAAGGYLLHRFGLEPSPERIDRFMRIASAGTADLSPGFWWSRRMLLEQEASTRIAEMARRIAALQGVSTGLRSDAASATRNHKELLSHIYAVEVGDFISLAHSIGVQTLKNLRDADALLTDDPTAVSRASRLLHATHRDLLAMEVSRFSLHQKLQRAWDWRREDDPWRSGAGGYQNLMWWVGSRDVYGYARALRQDLRKIMDAPNREDIRRILEGNED
mgnify:CR=1 FL=1